MKKIIRHITFVCAVALIAFSCVEPYQNQHLSGNSDLLVVDGFINTSDGTATVTLSHTASLSDDSTSSPELGATVAVRTDNGDSYPLAEQGSGVYTISGLEVNPSEKFQLTVQTKDNSQYISDYTEVKETPPIDSVTWDYTDNGLTVRVNAHDATGNTKYYRWDYVETWEHHSKVISEYIVENKIPRGRTADEQIYRCWSTVPSSNINVASTDRLAEDLVYHFPITAIPKYSVKISAGYSILVKQRAISKNEFEFLDQLRKTTESIGGIFDPQPSQVVGNIHKVSDIDAPVLGYFSAGTTTEQRLNIRFLDLPDHLRERATSNLFCLLDTMCVSDAYPRIFMCSLTQKDASPATIIAASLTNGGPVVLGYTLSSPACADCRTDGGTTVKPSFWP